MTEPSGAHFSAPTTLPLDQSPQIAAALTALAAAPGRLYPVAYLGPLPDPAPVRRALLATPRLRRLRVTEAVATSEPPDADVVICALAHAREARAAVHDRLGVQLLVCGEAAPDHLRADDLDQLGADAVLIDVRPDLAAAPSARIAEVVAQAVRVAGREPLVLLSAEDGVPEILDECELHLVCAGLRVRVLSTARDVSPTPRAGEAWLVALRDGLTPASAAAAAAGCRAAGVPLLVVAATGTWEHAREDDTWRAAVPRCSVARAGASQTPDSLPWPPVGDLWIGGVRPSADVETAMRIPTGTPLVAALAHLEISGRPGSLLVWGCDRIAVIRADQRAPGAVVVEVRLGAEDSPRTRDEALRALYSVRSWVGVEMAMVSHPHRGPGCMEETVTRVGFFLSRTDDERSAGLAAPRVEERPCAPGDVARTLVQYGLADAALDVLRDCAGDGRRSIDDALLLGFLLSERSPAEAVAELRDAAFRGASDGTRVGETIQIEATLNALLLLVRGRRITPEDAWLTLRPWLDAGGVTWATTAHHAAIAFELASRSNHAADARLLAATFDQLTPSAHPLRQALRPHLQVALNERRAA